MSNNESSDQKGVTRREVLSRLISLGISLPFLNPHSIGQSHQCPCEKTKYSCEPLSRIVFGSCFQQTRETEVWTKILGKKPQVFLFLGDNVYADTPNEMNVLDAEKCKREAYQTLVSIPKFAALRESSRVLAIWDDHDYGYDDVNAAFIHKEMSQQLFLEIFDTEKVRPRSRFGVYHAETFGLEDKRVQIILLDTRYHRNEQVGQMLGKEQWLWLEEQLKIPAQIRFICSGIQVLAADTDDTREEWGERWDKIPGERERLFQLLRDTNAKGVVFLSGDVHWAELSYLPRVLKYPLYDFTSSGLNTSAESNAEASRYNKHRKSILFGENFGQINIDWNTAQNPLIRLIVCNAASGAETEIAGFRLNEIGGSERR